MGFALDCSGANQFEHSQRFWVLRSLCDFANSMISARRKHVGAIEGQVSKLAAEMDARNSGEQTLSQPTTNLGALIDHHIVPEFLSFLNRMRLLDCSLACPEQMLQFAVQNVAAERAPFVAGLQTPPPPRQRVIRACA